MGLWGLGLLFDFLLFFVLFCFFAFPACLLDGLNPLQHWQCTEMVIQEPASQADEKQEQASQESTQAAPGY